MEHGGACLWRPRALDGCVAFMDMRERGGSGAGRRQPLEIPTRSADSTLGRLEGGRVRGAHGATWIRPYQAGGLTGLGVTHTVLETTADLPALPRRKPQPAPALTAAAWLAGRLCLLGGGGL